MIYSTEQRNILLSFLSENPDKMFSARQIESGLAGKGISKSAIYRNLAELEAEEKIRRCSKPGSREMFYQFYDCRLAARIFIFRVQNAEKFSTWKIHRRRS